MLVESMTPHELYNEVYTDLSILLDTTLQRLGGQYNRERKRKGIGRETAYPRIYEVRTKKKNNWMVVFAKPTSCTRYDNNPTVNLVTYFYTTRGLVVLKPLQADSGGFNGLITYVGHLFTRYNERMQLNLSAPLDKVRHFFINNGPGMIRAVERDERVHMVSVTKDGILLGKLQGRQPVRVLFKTFISKNEIKQDQEEMKKGILKDLQQDIEALLNTVEFDKDRFNYYADLASAIMQETPNREKTTNTLSK